MCDRTAVNSITHTAFHEGGHAVVGRVLGLTCGRATIVPDHEEGSAGHTVTPDPHRSIADWEARGRFRYVSMFRAAIMALMAGREAEIECLGSCQGVDASDQREIAFHIDDAEPPAVCSDWEEARDRFAARLRARTRALVHRHRAAIEAVASALLQHRTLDAEQIDGIVRDHTKIAERVDLETITFEEKVARAEAWATKRPASSFRVREV